MKTYNKLNAIFIIVAAVALGLACSSADQIAEANKTVDSANQKINEARDLYVKTEERNTALFSANIQTVGQLQAYKSNKGGEAKSIVGEYERASEMLKNAAKQYDDISRMSVPDKCKDYAKIKSDELTKRAEAINIRKGNAQAFMEIDDYKTMTTKFDENNSKSERLFKDAEDLNTKAKKMEEEKRDIFKQA